MQVVRRARERQARVREARHNQQRIFYYIFGLALWLLGGVCAAAVYSRKSSMCRAAGRYSGRAWARG